MTRTTINLLLLLLFLPFLSGAQKNSVAFQPKDQWIPETVDDPYIPVQRSAMKTSKAYRYSSSDIITVQVNVNENGENLLGDAANEPLLLHT